MIELIPLKNIIKKLEGTKYDLVITSGRGGLMASQFVAYALGIRTVHVMTHPKTIYPSIQPNQRVLLVDDINDSGKTIKEMLYQLESQRCVKNVEVAVLYERYGSEYKAKYVGERISHDDWLEFTWDKDL